MDLDEVFLIDIVIQKEGLYVKEERKYLYLTAHLCKYIKRRKDNT
jgi:hypothetical protein